MSFYIILIKIFSVCIALLVVACSNDTAESLLVAAKQHLENKENKSALIQLKNSLQKNPNSAEARFLLGKALLEKGDLVGAEVELQKALDLGYISDAVIPQLARTLLEKGQPEKVIAQYSDKKIESLAEQASLHSILAKAQLALGSTSKADSEIKSALSANPSNLEARILKTRLLALNKDFLSANKLLKDIQHDFPLNSESWQLNGDILLFNGQQDEALKAYENAIKADNSNLSAYESTIWILLDKNNIEKAQKEVDKLKIALPNNQQTKFFIALIAMEKGDIKLAKETTQQLLKISPDSALALQLAGSIELSNGSLNQASTYFSKALTIDPERVRIRLLLAKTYLQSGDSLKAIKVLQPIVNNKNSFWESQALMGQALLMHGDLAAAEGYFSQAVKQNKNDVGSRMALALVDAAKGQWKSGLEQLNELSLIDSGLTADLSLIVVNIKIQDYSAALKAIEQLEKKQPGLPYAANLRGQTELLRGRREQARSAFEEAMKIEPNFYPAVASLATMDIFDGRPERAEKRFENILTKQPNNIQANMGLIAIRRHVGAPRQELLDRLHNVIKASPSEVLPRLALVQLEIERGELKSALAAVQDGLAMQPANFELLDYLGRVHFAMGEYNQAMTIYKNLSASNPNSAELFLHIAEINLKLKDTTTSLVNIKKSLAVKSDFLPAQRTLMALQLTLGSTKAALDIAREIQMQRKSDPIGFVLEGDIQSLQKNWAAATKSYRSGLDRQRSTELIIKVHRSLLAGHQKEEALKVEQLWLKENAKDDAMLFYLGDVALDNKLYDIAQERFEAVLAIRPDNAAALNNLAWILNQAGKSSALEYALKANKLFPNEPAFMDTLAGIYLKMNKLDKAIEMQRAAIAAAPNISTHRLHLAQIYISAGENNLAKKELNQLTELGDMSKQKAEVAALKAKL